ncbi:MAG: hypothetical protein HY315_10455 [Acidobacteria bacterium]|nr:hypothetical protein [Acidobacteriota bacterium]
MSSERQKGEGAIGCVVILLLAILFGYGSFKVIPVYIDRMNFDEDLAREASRAGSNRWPDEKIKRDVVQMADFRGFHLAEEDITVSRSETSGGELRIEVRYSVPVGFPGYVHLFKFQAKAGSLVGSF